MVPTCATRIVHPGQSPRMVTFQADKAYVLLWNFADLIHPMLKLESPHEIFCFRFNPSTPGVSTTYMPPCVRSIVMPLLTRGYILLTLWSVSKGITYVADVKPQAGLVLYAVDTRYAESYYQPASALGFDTFRIHKQYS